MQVVKTTVLPKSKVVPRIRPEATHILDLGCGTGATLKTIQTEGQTLTVGVDISMEALRVAKSEFPRAHFVCASGEALPFRSRCFDHAVCGVALPYMDIPSALTEIQRVLKASGSFWASLHSFRMERWHWFRSARRLDLKDVIFRTYVLLNGFVFYLSGRVFHFPLRPRVCESFQSRRGMKIALRRAGFIEPAVAKFFVAEAQKTPDNRHQDRRELSGILT